MKFTEIKESFQKNTFLGLALPFSLIANKISTRYRKLSNGSAESYQNAIKCSQWMCRFCAVYSQLVFLGVAFCAAFSVDKYVFAETNEEALKVAGVISGFASIAVTSFLTVDTTLRWLFTEKDEISFGKCVVDDAFLDLLCVEGVLMLCTPAVLGKLQSFEVSCFASVKDANETWV